MISPPDRVTVWQSQLAANDFPSVCAMCGAPAETWRKFNFSTAPPWAFWVGGVILAGALARRAGGYLPMTRRCTEKLRLWFWIVISPVPLAFVFWISALVVSLSAANATQSFIVALLSILGLFSLSIGLIAVVVARQVYGPTGKVMEQQYGQYEPVIELQRVHPNFVMAVRQMQQARAAQYASRAPSPFQAGST